MIAKIQAGSELQSTKETVAFGRAVFFQLEQKKSPKTSDNRCFWGAEWVLPTFALERKGNFLSNIRMQAFGYWTG